MIHQAGQCSAQQSSLRYYIHTLFRVLVNRVTNSRYPQQCHLPFSRIIEIILYLVLQFTLPPPPSTAPPTRAHLTVSYSNALCLQLILPLNTPLHHPFNTFFTLTLPSSWVLRPPHISHRLDFLVFICLPLLLQIRDRPLITCSKKWRCRR